MGGESHELARCDAAGRPDTKPRGQARRNAKRWDGKRRLSETKTGSWGQSDQPDEDDDRCWCPPKVPEASPLIQLYPAHRHREPKNRDRKTHRVPARTAFLRSTVFSNRWVAADLQVCRSKNPPGQSLTWSTALPPSSHAAGSPSRSARSLSRTARFAAKASSISRGTAAKRWRCAGGRVAPSSGLSPTFSPLGRKTGSRLAQRARSWGWG